MRMNQNVGGESMKITGTKNIDVSTNNRGVVTVKLCREHKHNAFDDHMIEELIRIFSVITGSDARVMVLEAKGKSFSAGADLSWMKRMIDYSGEENLRDAQNLATLMKTLDRMPMTTIVKINGGAFGGALGLICCCDIAIGSEKSQFCLSEVKIGLIPATISPYVIAAIGPRAARRFFQTAEIIDANQALRLGLLSELVPSDQLDDKTEEIIELLLLNSPNAVKSAKQLIVDVQGKPLTEALIQSTSEQIANIRTTEEGQEGLKAFLEKRPASWQKNVLLKNSTSED